MKTLKTLKLTTQRTMKELELPNTLDSLQEQVGGYIEMPFLSKDLHDLNIDMVINEEGKLNGMEPTLVLLQGRKVVEVICGPILFVSHDNRGNTVSLNHSQMEYLKSTVFKAESVVLMKGNMPMLVKYLEV